MIEGFVTESLEAIVPIELRSTDGRSVKAEAVIDTGFSAFLTLPKETIHQLGLAWLCRQEGMLADGKLHPFDVYAATIVWQGELMQIEVDAAEADPLIGMSLLTENELRIQVRCGGAVSIAGLQ